MTVIRILWWIHWPNSYNEQQRRWSPLPCWHVRKHYPESTKHWSQTCNTTWPCKLKRQRQELRWTSVPCEVPNSTISTLLMQLARITSDKLVGYEVCNAMICIYRQGSEMNKYSLGSLILVTTVHPSRDRAEIWSAQHRRQLQNYTQSSARSYCVIYII